MVANEAVNAITSHDDVSLVLFAVGGMDRNPVGVLVDLVHALIDLDERLVGNVVPKTFDNVLSLEHHEVVTVPFDDHISHAADAHGPTIG